MVPSGDDIESQDRDRRLADGVLLSRLCSCWTRATWLPFYLPERSAWSSAFLR